MMEARLVIKRPGIYKWTNLVNGKVYVGAAARGLRTRYAEYFRDLPRGTCHNTHLQRAWDKYGEDSFEFSIIEQCAALECKSREEYWIAYYDATNPDKGYNKCKSGCSALGIKRSPETCAKISAANKLNRTPESIAAFIERSKNAVITEETRRKQSEQAKRHWQDPVWRANQIAKRKGKKQSKEQVEDRRQKLLGQKRSEEFKKNMRRVANLRLKDPEYEKKWNEQCRTNASMASHARWDKHRKRREDWLLRAKGLVPKE